MSSKFVKVEYWNPPVHPQNHCIRIPSGLHFHNVSKYSNPIRIPMLDHAVPLEYYIQMGIQGAYPLGHAVLEYPIPMGIALPLNHAISM
jgi:hypothetical protein